MSQLYYLHVLLVDLSGSVFQHLLRFGVCNCSSCCSPSPSSSLAFSHSFCLLVIGSSASLCSVDLFAGCVDLVRCRSRLDEGRWCQWLLALRVSDRLIEQSRVVRIFMLFLYCQGGWIYCYISLCLFLCSHWRSFCHLYCLFSLGLKISGDFFLCLFNGLK